MDLMQNCTHIRFKTSMVYIVSSRPVKRYTTRPYPLKKFSINIQGTETL